MTDNDDLFATFATATPDQLLRAVDEMLLLPWNTGADAEAESTIEGITVTSSEDVELHEMEFIRSTNTAGDDGERFAAVMNQVHAQITSIGDAMNAAWGEPDVLRQAEEPTECTFVEVVMDLVGIDEVLAWRQGERYILFCEGVEQKSKEYSAWFLVVARSLVEDVAFDITGQARARRDCGWRLPTRAAAGRTAGHRSQAPGATVPCIVLHGVPRVGRN